MHKVVAAIWKPNEQQIDRRGADGAVIRDALVDQGRYGAGDPFDVFVTVTVEDPDELLPAELGERVWAWTVDERRPRIGDAACAVTMVALMRRKPELSAAQFGEHWTTRHAPLALAHHTGLQDYTQNLVVWALTPGAEQVDGIAELGFRTREDLETRFYDSDDGRRTIGEDVGRFMAGPGPDTTLLGPPR